MSWLRTSLVVLAIGGFAAIAEAAEPPTADAPPTPPETQASSSDCGASPEGSAAVVPGQKDIFDVLRDWLHKAPPSLAYDYKRLMVAAAPVISYNPATGTGFGVAGNVAYYRGPPDSTQISSLVASATATTKSQVLVNAKLDASARDNAWNFVGDNRLYWTSQTTYGLGSSTTTDQAVGMKFDYFRFHETLYRKVRPNLFLGASFLYGIHSHVEPDENSAPTWDQSPYVTYSSQFGFPLESQTSAGASLNLLYSSRDSPINPSRGWYAAGSYQMFFRDFLGGTSTWQQVNYDLRTYLRLSGDARHRLAFWTFANLVTGGTAPYLDLPATGWDTYGRSGRGYGQGRFRGQRLLYGEAEYRWTITRNGLFGMVAFVNTETLSNEQTGEKVFDSFASAAGLGLRLSINKRSQTNLAVDLAHGQGGEHGIYLAVQEAF
ncbi:MAG TPA: BamA/TamA family outer membrane protein [Vicinamibacteria bacterium]|nr:BamA/TamA family outer membrane protein [Vicinamibacteria bacterium]